MAETARTGSRRPLVMAALAATLASAALLPVSRYQLGPTVSFVPAMLSVVACFDLLSVYLLAGDYRDRGDIRLLMMSWAYAWSVVVMVGYAMAFPGVVSDDPPLALTQSTAPYLYIAWHGGFPALLGAAWAPWPSRWTAPTSSSRRRHVVSAVSVSVAALSGGAVVALVVALAHRLPVLINGLDTSRMTMVTAPVVLPLVALALATSVHGTRRSTGPERWSTIAILVCLCDLLLTYFSRTRFSLGWYAGRSLTMVSAAVVLLAMLAAFRRLKARAEQEAAYDSLTGLHNRRSADAALDQLVARARRSGTPLGVVSLDLDHFKQVNDRHGHEAGDAVLVALAHVLTDSCRRGDLVARVGGEEFLVLLPDTDDHGALAVAEKVRARVASMTVPHVAAGVTASLGATALREEDLTVLMLLRRVDDALYRAKDGGRNRAVLAPAAVGDRQAAAVAGAGR